MVNIKFIFRSILLLICFNGLAQETKFKPAYPVIKGFLGIVHPIVTLDKEGTHTNFSKGYTVGFPMGITILKSDAFGFSFEVVPFIKAEDNTDKVTNVLFHPGIIFRGRNGFSFVPRLAFETNGRYGITPIVSKVFHHTDDYSLFASIPMPVRFGNEKPASVGAGILLGIAF